MILVLLSGMTVFFHNLIPGFLWSTSTSHIFHFVIHTFSPNDSYPFSSHVSTISTYFAA